MNFWIVNSSSSEQTYTVTLDGDDYSCTCPKWTFCKYPKKDCHHIEDVIDGLYDSTSRPEPRFVLTHCQQVIPIYRGSEIVEVRVPLLPMGDVIDRHDSPSQPEPRFVRTQCQHVIPVYRKSEIEEPRPLLPMGAAHTHFYLTLIYDCLRYGISWKALKEGYREQSRKGYILQYVESNGRCIQGDMNPIPYQFVPILALEKPTFKTGDYWDAFDEADLFLFTGNSIVKANGRLVMGQGTARQVRDRFPSIDAQFGQQLRDRRMAGDDSLAYHLLISPDWPSQKIAAFQTKHNFLADSDTALIQDSINALIAWAIAHPQASIHLPYPGIGKGNLTKEAVQPMLLALPSNVTIWTQ
jgi:hypothetical protein